MVMVVVSTLLMAYPFVVVMLVVRLLEITGGRLWPGGF